MSSPSEESGNSTAVLERVLATPTVQLAAAARRRERDGAISDAAHRLLRTAFDAGARVIPMRGMTELTIQDAMRAAHAELRHAAREREL